MKIDRLFAPFLLAIGLVIASFFSLCGQTTFLQTYDYDYSEKAYDMIETADGGYLLVGGYAITIGYERLLVIKTDSLGNEEWHRDYGYPHQNWAHAAVQTTDGNYLVAGKTTKYEINATFSDAYFLKLDQQGDTIWTKTYGKELYDMVDNMIPTEDGGIVAVGSRRQPSNNNSDGFSLKLDNNGNLLWEQEYGDINLDEGLMKIQEMPEVGYLLGGVKISNVWNGPGPEIWIIQTDYMGDTLWTKEIGWDEADVLSDFVIDQNNNILVAGSTSSFTPGFQTNKVLTLKLNAVGDTIWTKVHSFVEEQDGFNSCYAAAIDISLESKIIVAGGDTSTDMGHGDFFMLQLNQNGEIEQTEHYGNEGNSDRVYNLLSKSDGSIVMSGNSSSFCNYCVFLMQTDSEGNLVSTTNPELSILSDDLVVYPNPTKGVITISSSQTINQLQLIDQFGRILWHQKNNISTSFDLSKHVNGVYYLRIQTSTNKMFTRKIILTK